MSTVRFLQHDGKRIVVDDQHVTTEVRCDLCGEFIDREDVTCITIMRSRPGLASDRPLRIDAHPSCAGKAIDHLLTGPVK